MRAHSAFVAARSPILRAKLLESEVDSDTGMRCVVFADASVQAFRFLLSYIYCDAIHPTRNGQLLSYVLSMLSGVIIKVMYYLCCVCKEILELSLQWSKRVTLNTLLSQHL